MAGQAGQAGCVGRETTLAGVEAFLDNVDRWPSALVVEGDTGIGKSTVWSAGVAAAAARGYRVLPARPVEAEASLPLCALGDLLDAVDEEALAGLPAPQRRAFDLALLVSDGDERLETGERNAGVGLLTLLRLLSRSAPVVVALDDAEWLDGPSARAITFALRRLRQEAVAVLVTHRKGSDVDDPLDLERTLAPGSVRHVRLGPLSGDALRLLVRARVGPDLPTPALLEIERLSSGNPSIALEIARSSPLVDTPGAPLPVPSRLRDAARDGLAGLAPGVAGTLLVVAALVDPRVSLVEEVLGADPTADLLAAEAAGVVALVADHVTFVEPLTGSTLYLDAAPEERRSLHRRIAEVVPDPEERSFQLALAADGPDPVVAGALDAAAVSARARGARARAAELVELARSLTPAGAPEQARRRSLDAADDHVRAGNVVRARRLLEGELREMRPGPARAEVLARVARIRGESDSLDAAVDLGEQALTEADPAGALRATVAGELAAAELLRLEISRAEAHASEALDRAEELGDDALVAESIGALALADTLAGGRIWAPIVDVGIRLEHVAPAVRPARSATYARSQLLLWTGDVDGARRALEALRRRTADGNHEDSRAFVLTQLARLECHAGDWARASRLAHEAEESAAFRGDEPQQALATAARARVAVLRGDESEARALAATARALAERTGCRSAELDIGAAVGLLELSLGNTIAAEAELRAAVRLAERVGVTEPDALEHVPDAIEAAVVTGRIEWANEVLAPFEARSRELGRPWGTAVAARCRGLTLAAAGDVDAALLAHDAALAAHDAFARPFDLARTLLARGRTLRRVKQWGPARQSLERALETFEALGASLWVAATHEDLSRIGGRTPSGVELTTAERQAAELVARGLTNREVADTLYISLKTVEATLTRVYRKLGVRSRAELRARFTEPPEG